MAKLRIEVQVTLLAVVIASAVIATGYLAYKSLSSIVKSVQQEANPDYQLFLIKDIASDLANIENVVRLYVLTNNENNLAPYKQLGQNISVKLDQLSRNTSQEYEAMADSFRNLALEKLEIWQGVLNLHNSSRGQEPEFTEIYSKLEAPVVDTIITETKEKGFFRSILGTNKIIKDTLLVEKKLERSELKNEIENLESSLKEKDTQFNILESKLIEQNGEIGKKLNQLILWGENFETKKRIQKTEDAHRLAEITYKRLSIFSAAAVVLLLAVLFLLYNYQSKSRAYQQALKKAKHQAEKLARAKEQFAANVSHEMRTPVNAIYSLSEQLHQKIRDDETKKQLAILVRSASHLRSIINDTLDFSKIQARKLSLKSVHFSPSSVFEEVAEIQGIEALKKGIDLKYNAEHTLPDALLGDPLRLKQILINLVSNAIKFTDAGQVEVSVEATKFDEKKINLNFRVSDTGIGISKEDLKIIFDEFVQADNESGKKYSGTGLGLSIVKSIVEMQGGSVSVESQPGKGTDVFVTIPFSPGDVKKIELKNFVAFEIPEYFKKYTALIADDEEFNRFVLKNILSKWGIKSREAINGNEAVSMALAENFDVVFMDMRMPGKNGLEAAREILKEKPGLKIIAVTASDKKTDQEASLNSGMAGFLVKPFSENELFDLVIKLQITPAPSEIIQENQKINMDGFEKLSHGDSEFLKEMILLFIKTSENGLQTMREAIVSQDWKTVSETAHKMAAPCKHLHAQTLYEYLKKLESAPENNQAPELITGLYYTVKKETEGIVEFFRHYLQSMEVEQT
jgi:signal transduction histidine kinase/FixJ family two-component response regulator